MGSELIRRGEILPNHIWSADINIQNPELVKGLVVNDKSVRVANYHRETVDSVIDLLSATGHNVIEELTRYDMNRRISQMSVKRFDEIYPIISPGSFLNGEIPEYLINDFILSNENQFMPST